MMGEQQNEVRVIFAEALALTAPDERARYLEAACRDKPELRQRVEALLQAAGTVGDFLNQDALGGPLDCEVPPVSERPGTVIGHYKLLEQVGEGGFGVVFMAEQVEPIRRKVALKIVKPGMDTKQVIARFEAERQALALMDHPNIAKVFDAGATESGRPYFVMELVQGVPLTRFCDANNLNPRERLKLFMTICEAVQHAHQKGIIHRDLKPSNILVTLHDGKPTPKVIDFGTAKALQHPLTEKTVFTAYGKLIGTPQYMSPEQAELSGLDVDTRADIYSLGVLLYELLTGTTPFEAERLRAAAFEEMMHIIREEEPPRPSTRVSTLGERATEIAKHRQVDAALLRRTLKGDLDWIVMKALEKDRRRRYETANDLAGELQRHLKHEAVLAGPPGAGYRARKFVRRHRVGVGLAAAFTVVLALGLATALVGFAKARRERDHALAAESKAQTEAAIAQAVNEFVQQDLLRQASPMEQPDREVKLRALLDRASEKVGARFRDQPLVEAEIRMTLAETYRHLGEYTNARVHLDRALQIYKERLPPQDRRFLKARGSKAELLLDEGRAGDSQALLEQLLPVCERVLGAEQEDTLAARLTLVTSYQRQKEFLKAQDLAEEVVSVSRRVLGSEHPLTLRALNRLAVAYLGVGKAGETQRLLKETLPVMRRVLGPEHPGTLFAIGNLAAVDESQVKLAASEKQYEELLKVLQRVAGPEHPDTLRIMGDLAGIYEAQEQWAKAQTLREQLVRLNERTYGPEHRETLAAMYNVFWTVLLQDNFIEAQRLGEKLLPTCRRVLDAEDRLTPGLMHNLAFTYSSLGKADEAETMWREALSVERRVYGPTNIDTCNTTRALGSLVGSKGDWPRALALFQELLTVQPDTLKHWYRAHAAAMAAGQTNRCRELNAGMLAHWGASQDPTTCECLAKSLLLSSDRAAGVETGCALAGRAYAANPNSPWIQIAKAIAEYRLGHYPEAAALLERPRHDPYPMLGCLAAYFFAMARHQQGDADSARMLLESASLTFAETLRNGKLGDNWDDACRILVARTEAERLILGREASPPVTAEYLAERRREWEPLRQLLADGSRLAEQQKWPEARDAYARALADRAFGWKPAEAENDLLSMEMAVVFRKARDVPSVDRLCRFLVQEHTEAISPWLAEECARACFIHWQELAPELQRRSLELIRSAVSNREPERASFQWINCTGGIGEYRAGQWERALQLCQEAEESNETCCIGEAMLYRAMALKQLRRGAEAVKVLRTAEGLLAKPLKTRSGGSWWDLEVCQEALEEARELMADEAGEWPDNEESVIKLFADGTELAQAGRWFEARDAYARALDTCAFAWRAAERESPSECLALQMGVAFAKAGDRTNHERLCRFLLTLPPTRRSAGAAENFAQTCFLGTTSLRADLQQSGLELAHFALTNRATGEPRGFTCLVGGMAEYRAGSLGRAVEQLLKAEKDDNVGCKGGAMLYRAMALKRLGRGEEAIQVLREAEDLLAEPLARQMGSAWWDLGLCELALDEAHALLADDLAEARAKWEPILKLLVDASALGKERRWPEARETYARVLADAAFDWARAEQSYSALSLRVSVTFVETGDRTNYERLCRGLLSPTPENTSIAAAERHCKACLLNTESLPADLQQRAFDLARFAVTNRSQHSDAPWVCLSGGMAEFRAREFERALGLLSEAEGSKDFSCRGAAMVYRAMTLKRMGRGTEAAQVLEAAEKLLAGPLKRRMDPYWWDLDICQLALDEARQLFARRPGS